MKKQYQVPIKSVVIAFCILFLTPIYSFGITIGPGTLPGWDSQADVKLGWTFASPTVPADAPISGWNTYIGATPPEWNYDSGRSAWGMPGQWYIQIPNLVNDNPFKNIWISWVYEFDPLVSGTRSATNIDWPDAVKYENFQYSEVWFTSTGAVTTNQYAAAYARVTNSLDLYPSPDYEDIYLGIYGRSGGSAKYVTEVYIETRSVVPIPGAVWLFGSGLIGLVGIGRKRLKK